ncbi:hypothetical protein L596_029098 [Steinernema carpocapsae]|uniref:Uncharacterized protein n=1 Tax=Steinernema carpocapsae TaxID=34508 RepID=A0A4U5LTM5_STECR|nr:hypothetical protein L596_029098 [Steinernema carpocapsae]
MSSVFARFLSVLPLVLSLSCLPANVVILICAEAAKRSVVCQFKLPPMSSYLLACMLPPRSRRTSWKEELRNYKAPTGTSPRRTLTVPKTPRFRSGSRPRTSAGAAATSVASQPPSQKRTSWQEELRKYPPPAAQAPLPRSTKSTSEPPTSSSPTPLGPDSAPSSPTESLASAARRTNLSFPAPRPTKEPHACSP